MLSNEVLLSDFEINSIIKVFPKSGQKRVLLVNHKKYGDIILKIVEGIDERIKREINIITNNNIQSVPKILEINTYQYNGEKGIYLYEEYIDGLTLRKILDRGTMTLIDSLIFTESMLNILIELENLSIVHRDIKPDNIIMNKDRKWYLIDFGIARALKDVSLTMTGAVMGPHTPGYGAPELFQYKKRDIDSRADLFSLGVVLFEAITGKHPFINTDGMGLNDIWYNTIAINPELIQIDGDKDMRFISFIEILMEKHISRRPKNAKKAFAWFGIIKESLQEEV